jgi:hypothetical protein
MSDERDAINVRSSNHESRTMNKGDAFYVWKKDTPY